MSAATAEEHVPNDIPLTQEPIEVAAPPPSTVEEEEPHPVSQETLTKFLSIYELLLTIFTHASPKATSIAARSSRVLSQPALDVLWRTVPRASYLFAILGSLDGTTSYDGHSCRRFDFDRDLHPEDWDRFLPYSRRVEELSGWDEANHSDRWPEPSHKALAKLHSSRPSDLALRDIFPRLRSFTWSVYSHKVLRNMNVFLVPSLSYLEIKIDNSIDTKVMIAFLKQLQRRCGSTLKELRLNTDFALNSVEDQVIDLLESLDRLERLILPRFYINSRVFSALSKLPSLQFIGQKKAYWWGIADDIETGILPALEALSQPHTSSASSRQHPPFASLREMTYDTLTLFEAKKFMAHPRAPHATLRSICVTSNKLESPQDLSDFLTVLSTSARQLHQIDIGLAFPITSIPGHSTDITSHTLSPLLRLPNLTHFGIQAHFPIKMNDRDLDAWTEGLGGLRTLWLNETPAHVVQSLEGDVKSEMTLEALKIMARNCPILEELSLFVDATTIPEDVTVSTSARQSVGGLGDLTALRLAANALQDESKTTQANPKFQSLRYLNLGVSHITSSTNVANFINDLIIPTPPPPPTPSPPPTQSEEVQLPLPPLPPADTEGLSTSSPREPTEATVRPSAAIPQTPRPFHFDWSPRFWPAPTAAPEMEPTLGRRRDMWEDVRKMIPALMEQKLKADLMRREMMLVIQGLMKVTT